MTWLPGWDFPLSCVLFLSWKMRLLETTLTSGIHPGISKEWFSFFQLSLLHSPEMVSLCFVSYWYLAWPNSKTSESNFLSVNLVEYNVVELKLVTWTNPLCWAASNIRRQIIIAPQSSPWCNIIQGKETFSLMCSPYCIHDFILYIYVCVYIYVYVYIYI